MSTAVPVRLTASILLVPRHRHHSGALAKRAHFRPQSGHNGGRVSGGPELRAGKNRIWGPFLQNLTPHLSTLSGRLDPGAVTCLPQRFLPSGSLMNWDSGLGKVTPLNWETRGQADGVQGLLSPCFPIQKVEIDKNGNNSNITFPWSSQLMQTSTETTPCTSV